MDLVFGDLFGLFAGDLLDLRINSLLGGTGGFSFRQLFELISVGVARESIGAIIVTRVGKIRL